ncbi:MAG: hypothetical protein ACRDGM_01280 [bacterium]
MTQAVGVLLESAPAHISVEAVRQAMQTVEGVIEVHDLYVWAITSGMVALSAHVVVADSPEPAVAARVLKAVSARLDEGFGIRHTTIQVEHLGDRCPEPLLHA